jgi:hypothetical protein
MRDFAMSSLHRESVIEIRHRFKQVISLKERLVQQAQNLRRQAEEMPDGIQRADLLKKARQAEMTAHVDDWLSSPRLRPPQ